MQSHNIYGQKQSNILYLYKKLYRTLIPRGKSPIEVFNNQALATILEERKAFSIFSVLVYIYQP
jgi:ribosomal protein L32E